MQRLVVLSLIFVFNIPILMAQCPPSLGDPTWAEPIQHARFQINVGSNLGNVEYKFKQTGNTYEVVPDWSTLENHHAYFLTDEEFKSMMYKAVIKDLTGNINGEPCTFSGTLTFKFYEEASCRVEKVCYYRLRQGEEILCRDDGYPGNDPDLISYSGWKYYGRLTEYVDCGTTSCCEKTFTVECVNGEATIISSSTDVLSGSDCPEGDNVRCLDDDPMPCESTCGEE